MTQDEHTTPNTNPDSGAQNGDQALSLEYPTLNGKRVLIIEDDRFLHSLISDKLAAVGAEVVQAFTGEEGLEKIHSQKPDIVLLDILLPGVGGFEVLGEIKQDANVKDVPVVILSNLGQEEDIKKGTELGAEDFLIKANFTLEEILKKISAVLGGAEGAGQSTSAT